MPARNGMASEADRAVVAQYGEQIVVPSLTLRTLFEKHAVDRVDVLHVDVEGYDWMVLRQFDLPRYLPTVVRIEQSSAAAFEIEAARVLLRTHGYEVVDFYDELVGVRR